MKALIANLADFAALDPFFRIIEQGLDGLAGPGHFFDLLADDITVDYVVTVPGYPRHVEGHAALWSRPARPGLAQRRGRGVGQRFRRDWDRPLVRVSLLLRRSVSPLVPVETIRRSRRGGLSP